MTTMFQKFVSPASFAFKLLLIAGPKGEQDLAAVDGMNRFAAFMILCQIDLGEFLELSPEVRVEKFGVFVGLERMVRNTCFHE